MTTDGLIGPGGRVSRMFWHVGVVIRGLTRANWNGSNAMDTSANVTAAIFAAYLKCPTKAYLTAHGEKAPDTFFADIRGRISDAYKARASQNLRMGSPGAMPIDFSQLASNPADNGVTLFVDCETALYACDHPASSRDSRRAKRSGPHHDYVPILYSALDKSDQSDDLLVCFGGLAIGLATGTQIPVSGKVIYGEAYRSKSVRIANHLQKARQVIEAITSVCHAGEPPPLILNEHCQTCDFQQRCRALAVECDALSLLGAMTTKERAKCGRRVSRP